MASSGQTQAGGSGLPTHAGGKPVAQGPGIPAGGWKGGEVPQNLDPRGVNIPGHGVSATGAPINNMINGRKFFDDLPDNMDVRSIMARDQGMPMQRTMGGNMASMFGGGGGNLSSLFGGNQGYGSGGMGVNLPQITQPTRDSLGLGPFPITLPPRLPQQPAAPAPRPPTMQEVQQRVAQVTPGSEVTYGGAMGGGVNPAITGSMGAPAVFLQNYERWKDRNPAYAAQMLERSPFKSLFAPVQGTAPQQPAQPSQAALMARAMNERFTR